MYLLLGQDPGGGGNRACKGHRRYTETLFVLLNFAVNLKLLLKIKSITFLDNEKCYRVAWALTSQSEWA